MLNLDDFVEPLLFLGPVQNHGDLERVVGGIRQHVLGALNLRDSLFDLLRHFGFDRGRDVCH